MAGATNNVENKLLELLTGKTAFATPTVWVALVTVAVTETDTGATLTEATYTGYARKSTAGGDWAAAVAGAIENANAITFANATAGTSAVLGFALVDSASGAGNVLLFGTLPTVTISATQTPASFAVGALDATAD